MNPDISFTFIRAHGDHKPDESDKVKAKFVTPCMLSAAAMDRFNVRFMCKTDNEQFEYAEL